MKGSSYKDQLLKQPMQEKESCSIVGVHCSHPLHELAHPSLASLQRVAGVNSTALPMAKSMLELHLKIKKSLNFWRKDPKL